MKPIICFDWDGTIADSMDLCIAEVREALLSLGLPDQPDENLRACNGPTYEETVDMLGIPHELAEEYCAKRLSAELKLAPSVSRLYPGIRELLAELAPHATLCVVSNGLMEYLNISQQAFSLEGLFALVVGCKTGRTKGQNLSCMLDELGADRARAVMVGDRLGDIDAGKFCGIRTIAAGYGYGSASEYAQADVWVKSVEDLKQALLDFCSKA